MPGAPVGASFIFSRTHVLHPGKLLHAIFCQILRCMALAQVEKSSSLLFTSVFRPPQEEKCDLPHWRRNWESLA
ncbi:MAG TPA: hypothetical protein VFV38_13400 [Ktedonobacteraceae bacterium]|nr:hypothetical protein [Ktedonobacteraceae bacterium]